MAFYKYRWADGIHTLEKQGMFHCWYEILAGCIKKTPKNSERSVKEIKTLFQELVIILSVSSTVLVADCPQPSRAHHCLWLKKME